VATFGCTWDARGNVRLVDLDAAKAMLDDKYGAVAG
jgi:hypothetical protein